MTNDSIHTGTMTNDTIGSSNIKFSDENFSFSAAQGTFGNPFAVTNEVIHTGTMTNDTIH